MALAEAFVTERERFLRLMRGEPVDRPPLLEEGVRDEVIERWHAEGLPRDSTHIELFDLTPHENVGPDLWNDSGYDGRVFDLSAKEYARAFAVSQERFPSDWNETVDRLAQRDHIACVWASRGFFQALGVGDWSTFEHVLLGVCDHPTRVREHLEHYGEFCARMLELTLRDVEPEFIYLSEPISGNAAPLISPDMFEEFMIPVYRRLVATARDHGCDHILVSTYGNSAPLFPAMLDAGATMLWVSEAPEMPALDYRTLRKQFGATLGLIGGIPLGILRDEDLERIPLRLEELVPPLLASGRYVPLAGGRVRAGVSWAAYVRYREALGKILATAFAGSPAAR